MKKKFLAPLVTATAVVFCAFGFAACDFSGHTHNYGKEWTTDAKYHWHECTADGNCKEKQIDLDIHSDRDNDGICDICKYSWSNIGEPETVPVTGITLSESSVTLEIGGQTTLTATVKPDDATDKTVTWQSDKPEIAKVENGKITAVAEGKVVITATAGGKSATCTVKVNAAHDNLAGRRYMFNKAEVIEGTLVDDEYFSMEELNASMQGNYVDFGENNKAYIYGFVVCGDNARYEQVGSEIRIYTYPDEYPNFYWTFTYDGNNIINSRTIEDVTMQYTFTLQTN